MTAWAVVSRLVFMRLAISNLQLTIINTLINWESDLRQGPAGKA